jgi:CheY-like chemotaxis protein
MPTILVVDDDADIRRTLRRLLERNGYAVKDVESAPLGLEAVQASPPPDAIVCDVLMPGMTGLEFYRELLKVAPRLRHRLVYLTGANRDPVVHTAIEQLGVPLLGKLNSLELVIDAIRLALLLPVTD